MAKAHPRNAPGDFYVEDGCCITCGVPVEIAPDMFAWADADNHCFVRCQPTRADQVDRMIEAMGSAEVDCIRFRGSDLALARRIAEAGFAECCDTPPPPPAALVTRDRVSVLTVDPYLEAAQAALEFRAHLEEKNGEERLRLGPDLAYPLDQPRYLIRKPDTAASLTVTFSWDHRINRQPHFNVVAFLKPNEAGMSFSIQLRSGFIGATHGLALLVHHWLESLSGLQKIVWRSAAEIRADAGGTHYPI